MVWGELGFGLDARGTKCERNDTRLRSNHTPRSATHQVLTHDTRSTKHPEGLLEVWTLCTIGIYSVYVLTGCACHNATEVYVLAM